MGNGCRQAKARGRPCNGTLIRLFYFLSSHSTIFFGVRACRSPNSVYCPTPPITHPSAFGDICRKYTQKKYRSGGRGYKHNFQQLFRQSKNRPATSSLFAECKRELKERRQTRIPCPVCWVAVSVCVRAPHTRKR